MFTKDGNLNTAQFPTLFEVSDKQKRYHRFKCTAARPHKLVLHALLVILMAIKS